jgi:serum/glucocorticoid-regulated kinase 2
MVDFYCLGVLLYEMLVGLPPFYDSNKTKMFRKILLNEPKFPSHVNKDARDIITQLLEKDPHKRIGSKLGFKEVKDHPFCKTIDWIGIKNRTLSEECLLKLNIESSNFDLNVLQSYNSGPRKSSFNFDNVVVLDSEKTLDFQVIRKVSDSFLVP